MISSLAYSLILSNLLWPSISSVRAGNVTYGNACNIAHNRLSPETKQFSSDCTATTYCSVTNGTCLHKGCRKDEYPFGYKLFSHMIPDRCPKGEFCPDEEDACQPLLDVGSPCQLNRDDECAPPPNFSELAGTNNFNGSVCLNYQCMWANATLGNDCIIENTPYVGYQAGTGAKFVNVVSRGNCVNGLYCDAPTLKCLAQLSQGQTCTADKECASDNCTQAGICGSPADAPKKLSVAIYIVVAICIVGLMLGTLVGLYIVHRRHRFEEREKRAQYWREQEQFRQNIMQMREQARTSLLSLPWQDKDQARGNTERGDYAPTENSQTPMLHAASHPSGLRNEFSEGGYDDPSVGHDSGEDSLVMRAAPKGTGGQQHSRKATGGRRI
ncbi:hypothetical protein FRB94_000849 [Tulasnella sp. JGI-2019a]|nr:hypothetical protein FRB94_000849 [Tulasnella sp. JGI-2019a]KAG9014491.1 hypothetical protein FRB93_013616 [Tulasnella sp. JGI-2019a]